MNNPNFTRNSGTGIAVFNSAKAELNSTVISNTSVHGICARGSTVVTVNGGSIGPCRDRGIYFYQSCIGKVGGGLNIRSTAIGIELGGTATLDYSLGGCQYADSVDVKFKDSREAEVSLLTAQSQTTVQ